MANEFVLNSLLSQFLDDPHEITSDFDVRSLSAKDIEASLNGIYAFKAHNNVPRCC